MTATLNTSAHAVAIVDDDRSVRRAIGRILTIGGYTVRLFVSAEEFLASPQPYDCVVLDLQLPGLSGLELERHIQADHPHTAVVFFSAFADTKKATLARQTSRLCVSKPAEGQILLEAVARSIQARQFGPGD